jgi:BirA family biotin operon repressor/biotin-[acetyl-CoA-carboxylase] ligase
MVVTADEQTAGRGRQGRSWSAPPGRALLCSIVLREPPPLLPLIAGIAVAETAGSAAVIKWPNDVLIGGRKIAGILVEGRPHDRWAVLGIGLNVAIRPDELPPELRERAGTLGLGPEAIEPTLTGLLAVLARWLGRPGGEALEAIRARDALLGQPVRWEGGEGIGAGIDSSGRLLVATAGAEVRLDAGEVHLIPAQNDL